MSYTYVDTTNVNLVCCICRAPFIDPFTTRTCSHTFCRQCIFTALGVSPLCPIDRSPLNVDDLVPSDPLVRNLVDELLVECPQLSSGCENICQRQLVDSHLRDDCQYVEIACPDGQCDRLMLRKDADSHVHGAFVECKACGIDLQSVDLKSHEEFCTGKTCVCSACLSEMPKSDLVAHEVACPDVTIVCTHATNGCPWTGRRSTIATHITTCSYESIKGFFTINNEKVATLTNENRLLRCKADALEGMISVMKLELLAVKNALGPWYRSDISRVVDPFTSSNAELYSAAAYPELASNDDQLTPTDPVSSGPLNVTAPVASSEIFSSYFPSEEEDIISPADYLPSRTHSRSAAPSLAQYHTSRTVSPQQAQQPARTGHRPPVASSSASSYPPYPHPQLPSQQQQQLPHPPSVPSTSLVTTSLVAPLNLSTTLEGSLSGLHSSIITLSSAIDSVSRQHEVALTTEAMRTNEEIRSLRAVVHGLRMQVHAIMMDRNLQVTGRPGDGSPAGLGIGDHRDGPWPPYAIRYSHPPVPSNSAPVTKL